MSIKPIMLTNIMKQYKDTSPGPDVIREQVYETIWQTAGPIILQAKKYTILSGQLAPSQKESPICLSRKLWQRQKTYNIF